MRLDLRETTFDGCSASEGGGLAIFGSEAGHPARLSQLNFTRCVATGAYPVGGGGLFLRNGAAVRVEDSAFVECRASGNGGGVTSSSEAENRLTLTRVTFERCVQVIQPQTSDKSKQT